jgi:phosphatidylinositol alpha-1,6-mannosyltransferase
MRILYITRKFPPSIGGMQTQSKEFYDSISRDNEVFLIAWGYSQIFLPLFIMWAFLQSVTILLSKKVDIIQLGDLVLSPLGLILKTLFNKPVLTISHGKDSAYKNFFYDRFVLKPACKLDGIVCVSNYVRQGIISRGVPENKAVVIPNGIDTRIRHNRRIAREDAFRIIEKNFGLLLNDKKVILSVSRLVPKKGIKTFVEHGMPRINQKNPNAMFLIAGDGSEAKSIDDTVKKLGFTDNVKRLGYVKHDSDIYSALFSVSDVFVMPNIKVIGDAEGFGIVILEAGINGVPVVAYEVDGINDALHDNKNGILVQQGNNDSFADKVSALLNDAESRHGLAKRAKDYVVDNFSWDKIKDLYLKEYKNILENR